MRMFCVLLMVLESVRDGNTFYRKLMCVAVGAGGAPQMTVPRVLCEMYKPSQGGAHFEDRTGCPLYIKVGFLHP